METSQLPDRPRLPLHEYLRSHARERGAHPACIWYGQAMSYAELDRASDAFAARLQAIGVAKGEPVVLLLGNCPQYLVAHFGIQKIGAILCPSGPLNKEHELAYQLDDLRARVIVAASTLLPVVDKVRGASALEHVFVVHYADLLPAAAGNPVIDLPPELSQASREPRRIPAGGEDFLAVMRGGARPAPVELSLDDVALMTCTSGTTGLPKGAMLSYGNTLFKTRGAADCNGVGAADVLLSIAPLYHIAGMLMGINVPVYAGATSVLLHRFDPRAVLQAIEGFRISWWYSIAPMNVACMQLPDICRYELGSLRMNPVTSCGIAFTEALAGQSRSHAGNCVSFEGEADGYLTFIGRFKEMIKVSGYSVFPEEVESLLIRHPAVAQAAVIGQPDAEKGEVVKAFIVRKPGAGLDAELDAEALIAWSRQHMAVCKAPRQVSFIDALPTTGAGKVLRRLLKD